MKIKVELSKAELFTIRAATGLLKKRAALRRFVEMALEAERRHILPKDAPTSTPEDEQTLPNGEHPLLPEDHDPGYRV